MQQDRGADLSQDKATLTPLPFPFCGEKPGLYPEDFWDAGPGFCDGRVICDNDACAVKPIAFDGHDCSQDIGAGAYTDMAIKRWNTRF